MTKTINTEITEQAPATDPRTITYPLKTGGSLTTPCPAWCTYDHTDDVAAGIDPADLLHQGDRASLDYNVEGTEQSILQARIGQWPFSGDPDEAVPYVEFTPEGGTGISVYCRNRLELDDEIRRVRAHLNALIELGDQLAEAQAADHARHVKDGAEAWLALGRTDLLSMPIAYLLKVFGVRVVESDEPMGRAAVTLGGEPGDMLLLVNPDTPQHIREDATRTALLDLYETRIGGAA